MGHLMLLYDGAMTAAKLTHDSAAVRMAVTALMFAGDAWFIGPGAVALGELDLGFLFAGVAAAAGLCPLSLKLLPDRPAVLAPEPDVGGFPVQWVFERRATADEMVV